MKQKGGPGKQRIKKTIACQELERISSIYALEDNWKELPADERRSRRQEHSKPLVEAYFAWAKEIDQDSVISQKTKDGLNYTIHQERHLKAFLENGEIPIDNSASERAIRPFCVGRSNWHMIDTVKGAEASAIVYSIVETAKANDLKPYEYLKYLLTEIPKHIEDKNAHKAYLDDLLRGLKTCVSVNSGGVTKQQLLGGCQGAALVLPHWNPAAVPSAAPSAHPQTCAARERGSPQPLCAPADCGSLLP